MIKIYESWITFGETMIKNLLQAKQQYLSYFFEHLDIGIGNQILEVLLECRGTIFFTGVGKSGLVAKKIAATIASTGSRALYISPVDALHGDIGLVSEQDVFVLLSKSGETEELLTLLPHLQTRKAFLIALASNPNSRLVKACQLSIDLPLKQELCPFDLAPTTSTTIQMIFGDVLAMAMMRTKNITIEQYALNHPAGRIGKRAVWKVQDIMLTGEHLPICRCNEKIIDILVKLSSKRCGCVLVCTDDKRLIGIFTDGDLRRAIEKQGKTALDTSIDQFMTRTPKWIGPDVLLWEAVQMMEGKNKGQEINVLPVLSSEQKVVGLLKLHDIIQAGL